MEFTVEPTDNGVVLRPAAAFPQSQMDEVAGCLGPRHRPLASDRSRLGIEKEVRRRHDGGRY